MLRCFMPYCGRAGVCACLVKLQHGRGACGLQASDSDAGLCHPGQLIKICFANKVLSGFMEVIRS